MSARWISLLVVVVAVTCYQLAQRSIPDGLRPAPLFAFVYGISAILMVAVTVSGPAGSVRAVTANATHWAPWLLIGSIVGIELGFYAMYRAGWSIGTASVSTQAIVAAILAIVGLITFGEHLTPTKIAGIALCVAGAGLVVR